MNLLVLSLLVAAQASLSVSLCVSPWVQNGTNCYLLRDVTATERGKSWEDARATCVALGGDLLSIANQDEQNFITNIQSDSQRQQHYWIGFNDRDTEGNYTWSDMSVVNFTNWNSQLGEPNNWGGNEDCAEIHYDGKWNDNACLRQFAYICKRDINAVIPTTATPAPTPTSNPGPITCEVGWEAFRSSCYKFAISYRNWMEAKDDCQTRGGSLVIINDAEEQGYLARRLSQLRRDFWIGLSDNVYEGNFFWVDGSKLNYTHWGPAEPSNAFGGEDCVEMYSVYNAGTWNDNICTTRRPYICEKENGQSMCPEDWLTYGDYCYQINSHPGQKTSWVNARKSCQGFDGADLVTINSMEEQVMLVQSFQDVGIVASYFWIGLNDIEKEGSFVWADKSKRTMNNWGVNQPLSGTSMARASDCVTSSLSRKSGVWNVSPCYRSYYYACKRKRAYGRCHSPLGMQDHEIGDAQVSASSSNSSMTPPAAARLYNLPGDSHSGVWCAGANDVSQWLQIDLGQVHKVAYVAMQGKPLGSAAFVTSYYVQFGMDGFRWDNYGRTATTSYRALRGSSNQNTSSEVAFSPAVTAKYIRLRPLQWRNSICMRVELYGCVASVSSKCGVGWLQDPATGRCYQVGLQRLPWQNARANCLMQNADLASIASLKEKSYLESLLTNYSSRYTDFWVGLNDRDFPGIHMWTDGSPVSVVNWKTRSPLDALDVKDCVSVSSSDGYWVEDACERKLPYLCQQRVPPSEAQKRKITGNWMSGADAYWPLDAIYEGTTVTGTRLGAVSGATTAKTKAFMSRAALVFDGQSSYATLGSFPDSCISSPDKCIRGITFSFLVKVATPTVGYIIDTLGQQTLDGFGYSVYIRRGAATFKAQTSTLRWQASAMLGTNRWNHVVVSFSSGAGLVVYINDRQSAAAPYPSSFRGSGNEVVSTLFIGRSASSNSSYAQMEFTSLAVWKKVLTPSEISDIYSAETGGCKLGWMGYGDKCYQFSSVAVPWRTAQRNCQSQQASLVSISSSIQQSFVRLNVGEYGLRRSTWIGLNSIQTNHVYNWTDGSAVTFTNWGKNEPNNYGYRREDCTLMWTNGLWNDELCWTRQSYACIAPKGYVPMGQQVSEVKTVTIYEWATRTVGCPLGTRLQITYASYGKLSKNCSSATAMEKLTEDCKNQSSRYSCLMSATNSKFGDPCPGVGKELVVNYTCGADPTANTEGCLDGWGSFHDRDTCYKAFYLKKNWDDASSYCKSLGADSNLISINSSTEQMVANSMLINAVDTSDLWIGLNDKSSRGVYTWSDGSSVPFTLWSNGQPDDSARASSCVSMHFKNEYRTFPLWQDQDCGRKNGFICEMMKTGKSKPVNPTTPAPTGSCAMGWSAYNGYCYKAGNASLSWLEARGHCRTLGRSTDLVSIRNRKENDFVFNLLMNSSASEMWMGLTDKGIFRGQFWSDNSPVAFTQWDALEPNSYLNQLACGVIASNGNWRDEDCSLENMFICKSPFGAVITTTIMPTTPVTPTQDPNICTKNYKHWSGNGMCYYFGNSSDTKDWHQAKIACVKDGGTLTSILNGAEQTFIQQQLARLSISRAWIGLSDFGTETGFEWEDGSPYTFRNFEDGQPDDWQQMEDCVEMRYGGYWNDKVCSIKFPFICKKYNNSAVVPVIPIGTAQPDVGYCSAGWHLYGRKCYKFNIGKGNGLTWQEARAACQAQTSDGKAGNLASIHSSYENAFLLSHIGAAMESVYIGLNDLQIERTFTWSDQSSTDYINWYRRQPDGYGGKEDCVELMPYFNYQGAWNDMRCVARRGYVCQLPASSKQPTTPTVASTCPSGYQAYGDDCYGIKTTRMSWDDARAVCKKDDPQGELTSLHSPHQQAFVFSYFVEYATEVWIGLHRPIGASGFQWTDKTAIDYSHWGTVGIYTRNQAFCAHADLTHNMEGRWVSGDCTTKRAFVCQIRKAETSVTPAYPGTCSSGWKKLDRHCYKLQTYGKKWVTARQNCADEGGELASIHSKQEQDFIHYLTRASSSSIWIGMNDRQSEMKFQWSDGSPVDFINWSDTEPNDNDGQENCAEMNSQTGRWNDNRCSAYLKNVCKKPLECASALGMENGTIADASITASSSDDVHFPALARLNAPQSTGWCANISDANQYLQIDLGSTQRVTRLALQSVKDYYSPMYVKTYRVLYSEDGITWDTHQLEGVDEVFAGNGPQAGTDSATPLIPIVGRYIRINPLTWKQRICMKLELYGCPFVCENPLGLEKHIVKDAQMSSTSGSSAEYAAAAGRLNNGNGAWCAKTSDEKQWLQVDFTRKVTISKVATQGAMIKDQAKFVSAYRLSYGSDNVKWTVYKTFSGSVRIFGGNTNGDGAVLHRLTQKITARYLRFEPLKWSNGICLRAEVYGCFYECDAALGLQDGSVPDSALLASSSASDMYQPAKGRLGPGDSTVALNSAWCAGINNKQQFIEVNFGATVRITAIATQGLHSNVDRYVTSYQLQFSQDGRFWRTYQSNGMVVSFVGNQNGFIVKTNKLVSPIQARSVRINPVSWQGGICMRMEAYGCPVDTLPTTKPPTYKQQYSGSLRILSVEWSDDLAEEDSKKHEALENDIETVMTELYVNDYTFKDGFKSVNVHGFRKGSVVVKFTLEFTTTDENVTSPIVQAVKTGYLGKFKVDPASLKLEAVGGNSGKSVGSKGGGGLSHGGKVALVVIFMLLIVVVVAGGLFWFYRKRSRGLGQFKPQSFENPVHYSSDTYNISGQALIDT